MEIVVIILLIILNGIFAMAEIAIVSARKSRLKNLASEGSKSAQSALDLATSPNRFLSTVQIGITLIGILAGVFAGEAIIDPLSTEISQISLLEPYSGAIALGIVVVVITYLSLIIGELVPKRIALNSPEKIASLLARPMNILSALTAPLVSVLTVSTDWVLKILGIRQTTEAIPVSEEELEVVLSSRELTGSTFTRMFYMQGHGLRYFKLFDHQRGLTGTDIYVYKADWEGGNMTIVSEYLDNLKYGLPESGSDLS